MLPSMAMELRVPVVAPPLCRQIKCFRPFSDEDGSGSGVGFGEVGAKLLVLHGRSAEMLVGARRVRLVSSFLLIDEGFGFPLCGVPVLVAASCGSCGLLLGRQFVRQCRLRSLPRPIR